MEVNFLEEEKYILAKKKVKDIKDFYQHFIIYIIINALLSTIIVFGLMKDEGNSFSEAFGNFGVYATWLFWGIGVFFHWLGVFGFKGITSKKWEEKKIREIMRKEQEKLERITGKG